MTPGWQRLAWWWNRSWGTMTRRDVWLEHNADTGVFQVRWRLGTNPEDDHWYLDYKQVIEHLHRLLGENKATDWQETMYLDENGTLWDYMHPTDPDRAIPEYLVPRQPERPQ